MSQPGVRVVGQDGDDDPVSTSPGSARPSSSPGRPLRRHRAWVAVLVAALLLAVAAAVGFGLAWNAIRNRDGARASAVATTEALLKDMTNFDAATIDQDFKAIATFATGTFAQQLPPTFDNPTIRDQLKSAQAQSRGEIHSLYLATGTPAGQAKVYAVVDETAISNQYKGPVTDTLQFKVDLVRQAGGWRVDNLSLVNSTNPILPQPAPAGSTTTTTTKAK